MLPRFCTACVRTARRAAPAAALAAARPAPRSFAAFAPSAPLYKKAAKAVQQDEFAEDFEEDTFDDDFDEVAPPAPSPAEAAGSGRAERYAQAFAEIERHLQLSQSLAGKVPPRSPRLVLRLVRSAEPAQLPDVLRLIAQWRSHGCTALTPETVELLVKRLAQLEDDNGRAAVEVLSNRTQYGVELPDRMSALYPLFAKISKPQAAAAAEAGADAVVEEAVAPKKGAYRPLSANPSDLAFVLFGLAELYLPAAARFDALALLATLSAALRGGELDSARVKALVAQVQQLGEDAIVEQAHGGQKLSKRWSEIVRMRAHSIAVAMQEKAHPEVEWFSHLAETLQSRK
ncbi:uncharacterized protein JCM10292_005237 [Rhodotorula paludigena]|uniref:uncharacterized protein n=1 Tax=Rhodotorula paludigena TaxID=86838 RepID=UPI003176ADCA